MVPAVQWETFCSDCHHHAWRRVLRRPVSSQEVLQCSFHIVARLPQRLRHRPLVKTHRHQLLHRLGRGLGGTRRRRGCPRAPSAATAALRHGALLLPAAKLLLLLLLRRSGCNKHLLLRPLPHQHPPDGAAEQLNHRGGHAQALHAQQVEPVGQASGQAAQPRHHRLGRGAEQQLDAGQVNEGLQQRGGCEASSR